jgi:hypothetical protein
MMAFRCLMLLPILVFISCCENETSREEARIRDQVDQRVEIIRSEMKVTENRWHTVRVVAFCLLAGGSLIWLFNGGATPSRGSYPLLADARSPESGPRRRVIDRTYDDDEPDDPPYRR